MRVEQVTLNHAHFGVAHPCSQIALHVAQTYGGAQFYVCFVLGILSAYADPESPL